MPNAELADNVVWSVCLSVHLHWQGMNEKKKKTDRKHQNCFNGSAIMYQKICDPIQFIVYWIRLNWMKGNQMVDGGIISISKWTERT